MFRVVFTKRAEKSYNGLTQDVQNRCTDIFDELQYSLAPIRLDVKKLKGHEDTYRIRLGDWRIIYKVDTINKLIVVYDILSRKTAYREFK
jgi:mRNA interferase RelE/StbE